MLKHGNGDKADKANHRTCSRISARAVCVESDKVDKRAGDTEQEYSALASNGNICGNDKSGVLHADECDEQTDTDGNGAADTFGYSVKNLFANGYAAYLDNGQKQEQNTADEDKQHNVAVRNRKSERAAQNRAHGIVKSHTRSLCKGHLCHKSH